MGLARKLFCAKPLLKGSIVCYCPRPYACFSTVLESDPVMARNWELAQRGNGYLFTAQGPNCIASHADLALMGVYYYRLKLASLVMTGALNASSGAARGRNWQMVDDCTEPEWPCRPFGPPVSPPHCKYACASLWWAPPSSISALTGSIVWGLPLKSDDNGGDLFGLSVVNVSVGLRQARCAATPRGISRVMDAVEVRPAG